MADIFPSSITAGLTLDRRAIAAAYPAPEWRLQAVLRGPGLIGTLQAEPDGHNHRFRVSAAETAKWVPGDYWYSVRALQGETVLELEAGKISVQIDLAQEGTGFNGASHTERVLAAIEAVLERRATLDQEEYRINNRELKRTPIADLLRLRDRYRMELQRAKAARNGKLFGVARVAFR